MKKTTGEKKQLVRMRMCIGMGISEPQKRSEVGRKRREEDLQSSTAIERVLLR